MNVDSVISLLVQVPLVAVFIWYALESNKRHQESQNKVLERYQESMERRDVAYLTAIQRLTDEFETHDSKLQQVLAIMRDRKERQ